MTNNKIKLFNQNLSKNELQICSRCIYDETTPNISFNNDGVCNYCVRVEDLKELYGTGEAKGEQAFLNIIENIKKKGKGKKYDCIIGVSGGTDSSYLLYLAKKNGLRPLAVHYDNTWNSAIATMNLQKVLKALDIDLYTHVLNNKEADDIFRAFFLAGVSELDSSTDLGFAYLLRIIAAKYSINYILEGHSFIEEGISPLGKNYFDGKYIKSIHKKFGRIRMKTYPLMTLSKFLWSIIFHRVKFIRPFWYIRYDKEIAKKFLSENYGWIYYGGHHLENRVPAFLVTIYQPKKFNLDQRNNSIAAKVRNGNLSRKQGLLEYNKPIQEPKGLKEYFIKRLDLTDKQYEQIMNSEPKYWIDYPTYKKWFEFLRPLFYIFMKLDLIPMSFYLKYCFKSQSPK